MTWPCGLLHLDSLRPDRSLRSIIDRSADPVAIAPQVRSHHRRLAQHGIYAGTQGTRREPSTERPPGFPRFPRSSQCSPSLGLTVFSGGDMGNDPRGGGGTWSRESFPLASLCPGTFALSLPRESVPGGEPVGGSYVPALAGAGVAAVRRFHHQAMTPARVVPRPPRSHFQ